MKNQITQTDLDNNILFKIKCQLIHKALFSLRDHLALSKDEMQNLEDLWYSISRYKNLDALSSFEENLLNKILSINLTDDQIIELFHNDNNYIIEESKVRHLMTDSILLEKMKIVDGQTKCDKHFKLIYQCDKLNITSKDDYEAIFLAAKAILTFAIENQAINDIENFMPKFHEIFN